MAFGFFKSLIQKFSGKPVDWDELEESLIRADLGVPMMTRIITALQQAREFHAATGLTGVIVTKLDGSGKGGCVVAIQNELGIPTRFIGTGEKIDDLDFFESRAFVEKML